MTMQHPLLGSLMLWGICMNTSFLDSSLSRRVLLSEVPPYSYVTQQHIAYTTHTTLPGREGKVDAGKASPELLNIPPPSPKEFHLPPPPPSAVLLNIIHTHKRVVFSLYLYKLLELELELKV